MRGLAAWHKANTGLSELINRLGGWLDEDGNVAP